MRIFQALRTFLVHQEAGKRVLDIYMSVKRGYFQRLLLRPLQDAARVSRLPLGGLGGAEEAATPLGHAPLPAPLLRGGGQRGRRRRRRRKLATVAQSER